MTIPGIDHPNGNASVYTGPTAQDLSKRVETLERRVETLTERVTTLEDAGAPQPREDAVHQKILDFLRRCPGVKFTAPSIAENVGEPTKLVQPRLRTLTRRGLIVDGQREGGVTRLYHVPVDVPDAL